MSKKVEAYKVEQLPAKPLPNTMYYVKGSTDTEVVGYITDLQGIPYPLKDITEYTDEDAQDAVGNILTDTATIDFTYNDTLGVITADVQANSITANELSDTIPVSEFINDAGYITSADLVGKTLIKEEFDYIGSQNFITSQNFISVHSVSVNGIVLSITQYSVAPSNQVSILDILENTDYIIISYFI